MYKVSQNTSPQTPKYQGGGICLLNAQMPHTVHHPLDGDAIHGAELDGGPLVRGPVELDVEWPGGRLGIACPQR